MASYKWSLRWDLNPQPLDYKSSALPIELREHETTQEGFEPPVGLPTPVFKTGAISLSTTAPDRKEEGFLMHLCRGERATVRKGHGPDLYVCPNTKSKDTICISLPEQQAATCQLGMQGSNLRMRESKSRALPTWLRPNHLSR